MKSRSLPYLALSPGIGYFILVSAWVAGLAANIYAVENLSSDKIVQLQGHQAAVKKLVWSPSGRLISADSDAYIFVWEPGKKRPIDNYKAGYNFVRSLEVFDSGRRYLACMNTELIIGSVGSGRQIEKISEQSGGAFNRQAAASPDGKIISAIITGPSITQYSASNGKVVGQITPPQPAASICYTRDGRLVVGADSGQQVWVYEPGETKPSFSVPISVGRCEDVKLSPDGRWLAAIGTFAAQISQLKASADPQRLEVGDKNLEALAWSPDSEWVVTAGATGLVQFWERRSGKLKKQLQLGMGQSSALAFSPDGHWLSIGSGDYVDMTKAPPRQTIDDKSIRLLEMSPPDKATIASVAKAGAATTEVAIRLRTLQQQFEAAVLRTGGEAYKRQLIAARQNYAAKLESESSLAAKAGNLDLAVAIRDEKAQVQKQGNLPVMPTTSPQEIKLLRDGFNAQLQSISKARMAELQPLFDKFDQMLSSYQDDLTKRQRLEEALTVKDRRDKLAIERAGESPP